MSDSELYYDHPDQSVGQQQQQQPPPPPLPSQPLPPPQHQRPAERTPRSSLEQQRQPPEWVDRANVPHRSSTLGSPYDLDRRREHADPVAHARSEDLNHGNPARDRDYNLVARPDMQPLALGVADAGSIDTLDSSIALSRSNSSDTTATSTQSVSTVSGSICSACGRTMQGAFVRALGTVFHLNCFKCMDCGDVVAQKFFPIDGPDGRQYPLCERDYFRRLNLICAKCEMALRGSYITACNKKFHVEHFTCSLCATLFGPQDSYYEHEGDVYCHYHYSTRFATKCAGCASAILKQFVEINRNNRDECWHPECYMINKFWNVKLVSRRAAALTGTDSNGNLEPPYAEEERRETPNSLRDKQVRMEQQVYRIWTVLSAFEESSAACISDMLRQVSNGQYLDAIRMAEKFILHVEVLFAAIDDLEFQFASLQLKGMSHVQEARMLCRKTVDLFTLLSHTNETGARRMGMTQELLALVTGLAHYLKILIRIALTGALRLEREHARREAVSGFLDKLHLLAVQGGSPAARRVMRGAGGAEPVRHDVGSGVNFGTQGVTYGFRSLAPENAGDSPFWEPRERSGSETAQQLARPAASPSDLCVKCGQTVEEDCVRLGTYQRWHSHCVACVRCGRAAAPPPPPKEKKAIAAPGAAPPSQQQQQGEEEKERPKLSTARRPPADVDMFMYEDGSMTETTSFGRVPTVILCTDHAHQGCRAGFQPVSRLEQYAFLLNVALRRLYILLKKRGVVPLSPVAAPPQSLPLDSDPYRDSGDIMRMKSVHLDRKISATARLPKRSTIVESPAGKSAHPTTVPGAQRQDAPAAQYPVVHGPGMRTISGQSRAIQGVHAPGPIQQQLSDDSAQVLRPPFARNNTGVMIVDESGPSSPAYGPDESPVSVVDAPLEDGITLADIPQLMEAAQAREQRRSLPRQSAAPFVAELGVLELAIVKHAALLVLARSPLKDQFEIDDLLELVEVKKGGFWKQLFRPGNDKKNVKKRGTFGVPLEVLVEREGADSMLGASRAPLRIPSFIDDVVSAMRQMDMSVEGIFRKNGNIRRLNELTEAIDRDASSVDLTTDKPVQLAALLKKFLRELPDPLLTFKLHRLLVASQSLPNDEDRKRLLHMVSLLLPKYHRDTMEVLFVFLKWVASFAHIDAETGSKMDLGNLATVICPSILKARSKDPARDESFGGIRVVTALLENQDEYYVVPEEFIPLLRDQEYFASSLELPGKEFMKKCDTYMRMRANGRNPAVMSPTITPAFPSSNSGGSMRPPDGSDGRTPRPMDRSTMASPSPTDMRNRPRQQSPHPPPMQRAPMSYPPVGAPPPAGMDSVFASQQQQQQQQQQQDQWAASRQYEQPRPAPPRPNSFAQPRQSGEQPRPFVPNGSANPPMQLRQRS